jgi:PAS domain S-box-containing protein
LFHVEEGRGRFVLIDQSYDDEVYSYPKGYWQKLDQGVLSHVYRNRQSIRSGNVHSDLVLKDCFKQGLRGHTLSELAIPIIVNNKICAILNSEDKLENAYSAEEQRAVELVLGEVAAIYRRIELEQLLSAILNSVRDAIFRTDGTGVILWVNPSAGKLLGYGEDELVGKSLGDLIADPSLAELVLKADGVPNDQLVLTRADGSTVSVLISGSPLPEEVGGRVYVASDMSLRRRSERLDYLRALYHEIATQSQVPLSLCFSWLRRLSDRVDEETGETLVKVIRQLKKTQLTFDRLTVFERDEHAIPFNPVLLDLSYVMAGVRKELPRHEADQIEEDLPRDLPPIRGDIFQLSFCLQSVLSYIARFAPPNGRVRVSAKHEQGMVRIEIRGTAPERKSQPSGPYADEAWLAHALLELTLGKRALERFLANHKGSFEGPERIDQEFVFRLALPPAAGDETT